MAPPANEPAVAPLLRVRGYSYAALGVENAVVNLSPLRFNEANGRLQFPVSSTSLGGPVGQRSHGGLLDIALLDCGATEVKVV